MIWSEQELANMAIGGRDMANERVIKQLDNLDNADIFEKKNFSLLWGILGITGVDDASNEAKEKIWESLKQNGVLDAYDKGILADFNRHIAEQYNDNRMRAWLNMDNFEAGMYFRKIILKELSQTNEKLEKETISYCFDEMKLVSSLSKEGLTSKLKTYLESLRKQEADNATSGTTITRVFEKEMVLRKLADVIVTSNRPLTDQEKNYLYYYLREAVASGFEMNRIGLNDQVLSRLMADFDAREVAEVEAQSMLMRNADVMEFVAKAEESAGFFEESAAKFIKADKGQIPVMVKRCMDLIQTQDQPRGVVFALELINLGQIKSAVTILEELAKKGAATEMTCLLHRLLPQAKGAEKVLLSILQINLRNQHTRNPWGDNSFFFEYISRRYLQAAKMFANEGYYKESAALLQEIVLGKWFEDQEDLMKDFLQLTNWLLSEDKSLEEDLASSIKRLHLQVFRDEEGVYVGTESDNPITAARHRLEQKIKTATTFDVSKVLDKMADAENSTYKAFKNIKEALSSDKKEDENISDELPPIALEQMDEAKQNLAENTVEKEDQVVSVSKIEPLEPPKVIEEKPDVAAAVYEEEGQEEPQSEPAVSEPQVETKMAPVAESVEEEPAMSEKVITEEVAHEKTEEPIEEPMHDKHPLKGKLLFSSMLKNNFKGIGEELSKIKQASFRKFSKKDNDSVEVEKQVAEASLTAADVKNTTENVVQSASEVQIFESQDKAKAPKELASEIQSWEDDKEAQEEAQNSQEIKNGVNINKILDIKSEEVDSQFDKIRKMTLSAVKRAEEKVATVKKQIEESSTGSQSVSKIKELAGKMNFFKKK